MLIIANGVRCNDQIKLIKVCQKANITLAEDIEFGQGVVLGKHVSINAECFIADNTVIDNDVSIGCKSIVKGYLPKGLRVPQHSKVENIRSTVHGMFLAKWDSYGEHFFQIGNKVLPQQQWKTMVNSKKVATTAMEDRDKKMYYKMYSRLLEL